MPYKLIGKTIYTKATGKWRKKQTCKSVASAKRALSLLQGLESGSIKPSEVGKGKFAKKKKRDRKIEKKVRKAMPSKKKKWTRKVDTKMRGKFGEIDYEKKLIKVNPKKGEVLRTILHEEAHKQRPDKTEKWIEKKAKQREKKLSIPKAIKLLNKFKGRKRKRK